MRACKHCGRKIIEVHPRGAMYDDDRIWVHIDSHLSRCGSRAPTPYAIPATDRSEQ